MKESILTACILFGTGLGTCFFRRSFFGVLFGLLISFFGLVLLMASFISSAGIAESEFKVFLAVLMFCQPILALIGLSLMLKRYRNGLAIAEESKELLKEGEN